MKFLGFDISVRREKRASPENPRYSLDNPSILDMLGVGDGGGDVTPATAMRVRTVFSCVRVISEAVGQLPVHVYRRLDERRRERVTDHPVAKLLQAPNPIMRRTTFLEQQTAQMCLWGASFANRVFDSLTGETIALYPWQSASVTAEAVPTTDARGYPSLVKRYQYQDRYYTQEQVLQVLLLSMDGVTPMSPIRQNSMALSVAQQQQKFADQFYRNGVKLAGVLEHPSKLGPEAAARLRENWSAVYHGAANAGKVAVLEEGMKFAPLVMPLEDAQFIETAKYSREEIAAIFRVPPHMIGHMDRATFSNIEHQSLEFAVYTLTPYLVKLEAELAAMLFTEADAQTHYLRFNLDALARGDLKSRYEAYAIARQWGWASANDVLDLEDRNPIENGDIYLHPMNMVPAGTPIEKYLKGGSAAPGDKANGA